jgi:carboxymethylenebutenolidase
MASRETARTSKPPAHAVGESVRRTPRLLTLAALGLLLGCGDREDAGPAPAASPTPAVTEGRAHEHAGDDAAPSPAVGRPGGPHAVETETVAYGEAAGEPIQGFLARPRDLDGAPGVLLVHEWWGLNDNLRDMARQLASHGYLALAVDLYGGRSAENRKQAIELVKATLAAPQAAEANLRQAAAFLRQRGAGRLGVVGWCFGGDWALRGGMALGEEVDAVVMYYGEPRTSRAELARLQAPLLGLFGGDDQSIPVATVRDMESTLRGLGKPVEIHVFPGARHAFANPSGKRYEPEAAEEAWRLTLEFLETHLGPA